MFLFRVYKLTKPYLKHPLRGRPASGRSPGVLQNGEQVLIPQKPADIALCTNSIII